MNDNSKKITLNFLPIDKNEFKFALWCRPADPTEKRGDPNIKRYKLPNSDGTYKPYWVSFEKFDGADKQDVSAKTNIDLTKFYLFKLLESKLRDANIEFRQRERERRYAPNHLYIIVEKTKWGEKAIRLEPYYLKANRKFGFLVDYKFLKSPETPFSREVQMLSFSLDNNYRSNVNYHIDKFRYIQAYLKENIDKFLRIKEDLKILNVFEELEYANLKIRKYKFMGEKEDNSQFNGLMKYGPYKLNQNSVKYIYIYPIEYKDFANDLIKALNGENFKTFEGLEKLKLPIQIKENTIGITIDSYKDNPESFLSKVESSENPIVIAIFPAKEEKFYYSLKNYCLRKDIPLQTVHLETLMDENKLKWAVSGIALQIFTKLGGIPWIVESENKNCLIVGIGQSIERSDNNILKFFAYAVLLKSSGEFLAIEPLSSAYTKDEYIKQLLGKIVEIVKEYANYKSIVFHVPEKIKLSSIREIEKVLKENVQENIELYIIRVNDDSKFFGYDKNNNSLIPFESSYVQLSHREFLLWTEGLNYHNLTPRKRYSNPIYVDFYYSNQKNIDYKSFLQDILNLSGVNYRGFNAKSLPVSMYYPKLISSFYKHFNQYNLELIMSKKDKMWFI